MNTKHDDFELHPLRMEHYRSGRWFGLIVVICLILIGVYYMTPTDDSTPRDLSPLAPAFVPLVDARPTLRSVTTLPGSEGVMVAKPVIAADRDGTIVAAAMQRTTGSMRLVRWRSTDHGRTWDQSTPFEDWPSGNDFAADPWLVTDHRNRFHLIQLTNQFKDREVTPGIYRRSTDGGATWAVPIRIAEFVDRPVIAVSPDGRRLVIVMTMADPDAVPLTATDVVDGSITFAATNRVQMAGVFRSDDRGKNWCRFPGPKSVRSAAAFSTAIDNSGRIAATWIVNDGEGSKSIVGVTKDGGKTWTETVLVKRLQPDRPHPYTGGRFPLVTLDGSGRLHALFVGAGGKTLFTQVSSDWERWSDPMQLSSEDVAGVRFPALAASGDVVHAVWMEQTGQRYQMRYRATKDGGVHWSDTLTLAPVEPDAPPDAEAGFFIGSDDDQPAIADDGCGSAHVVWTVRSGKPEKYVVYHAIVDWRVLER